MGSVGVSDAEDIVIKAISKVLRSTKYYPTPSTPYIAFYHQATISRSIDILIQTIDRH